MPTLPFLIVGQGLAGTAMAWHLWERGEPFLIIDRDEPITSSKVAAGLLTPVTGMRMSLSENYASWLFEAVKFYRSIERRLGIRFLHSRNQIRCLKSDKEVERWAHRLNDPEVRRFVRSTAPTMDETLFHAPRGCFEMKHSGWLDTRRYLEASRAFFTTAGCYSSEEFQPDDLAVSEHDVTWQKRPFREVIFCTGWEAMHHPWFDWVPFQPARGTILTARADLKGERRIINGDCWIIARQDGTLRIGSTYELKFTKDQPPDPAKLADLHERLQRFVKVPVEILEEETAVRPSIMKQLTLIGRHPSRRRVAFFNGLGSKGTLRSPHFARVLMEHLLDHGPIPPEMDLCGNW